VHPSPLCFYIRDYTNQRADMTQEERINEECAQWLAFGRTMEMVLEYDDAICRCLEFIFRQGIPECSIPLVGSNGEITSSAFTKLLLCHLEEKEDYENCGRLVACMAAEPDTDLTDFLSDAQVVASFEINCNKCQEVITDIDIFYEVQHPRDYVRLMDILIHHFQGRLNHEQMETLQEVRATVIFDIKGEMLAISENFKYFFYTPPKKDTGGEPDSQ
jgi:hypothetical protein